jgi:hypothetical protein
MLLGNGCAEGASKALSAVNSRGRVGIGLALRRYDGSPEVRHITSGQRSGTTNACTTPSTLTGAGLDIVADHGPNRDVVEFLRVQIKLYAKN